MGREVASDSREPGLTYNNEQIILTINCIEKMKMKKKEAGHGLFLNILFALVHLVGTYFSITDGILAIYLDNTNLPT